MTEKKTCPALWTMVNRFCEAPTVIAHNDNDGRFAAAVVVRKYERACVTLTNYGQEPTTDFAPGSCIYVLDFSFPLEEMRRWTEVLRCWVVWIDHHPVIDTYAQQGYAPAGLRTKEHSGAYLTWLYMFPGTTVPRVIELVSDYDTWAHKYPESLLFHLGSGMLDLRVRTYEMHTYELLFDNPEYLDRVIADGAKLSAFVEYKNKLIRDMCAFPTTIRGIRAAAINAGGTNSLIFYEDGKLAPGVAAWKPQILITYTHMAPLAKYRCSLYSIDNEINVGRIAEALGGGGHAGASGFMCENLPFALPTPEETPPAMNDFLGALEVEMAADITIRGYVNRLQWSVLNNQAGVEQFDNGDMIVANGQVVPIHDLFRNSYGATKGAISYMLACGWYYYRIVDLQKVEDINVIAARIGGTVMADGSIVLYRKSI